MASNDCGNGRVVWLTLVFLCLCSLHWTSAQKSSGWKTLSGKTPLVIAHGGLSGIFPDQTTSAYIFALNNSLVDAVMFCDLQLTKDGQPICRTDLRLDNSTTIASVFPNQSKTYLVNGANITGWFSIDFTSDVILENITAMQSFTSRTHSFDGAYQVLTPDLIFQYNASIWLNVQYSKFFEEHNLSMPAYVRSLATLNWPLGYISSTEVGFLRDIALRFRKSTTKLILRFLDKESIDPSINETYGSILKNLTFVKTFAAGILVPKSYIWPQSTDGYLQAPTNLVKDAHAAGLEIFAGDLANDEYEMSYNYSYNPINEHLQFVDNGDFAVDGVLTDFPITASSAIACYAQNNDSVSSRAGNPLIIAHSGASGDYPGSTDVAYQAAIRDGADYIECSVQITKDGIPFCMESPDLTVATTITSNSAYYPSLMRNIPSIKDDGEGIFTFDLTWKEIESLTPNIYSPSSQSGYSLLRNPAEANVGKFMNLTAFLEFAKKQADVGVLLNIESARAIILKASLDVTNATLSALKMAGYDNMSDRLSIQSDDSAVLLQFKQIPTSKLVFTVDESFATVPDSTIQEIKGFANAVAVPRTLIYENDVNFFLTKNTNLVTKMKHHNVSVFAINVRNEFSSLAMDYEADPTLQINSLVQVAKVDGLVTDFPATAKAYFGNACLRSPQEVDYSMFLVDPGSLVSVVPPQMLPPALAPAPTLLDVVDPPLPALEPVSSPEPTSSPANVPAPSGKQPSGACHMKHSSFISLVMGLVILFFNSC